ncbi:hypothetical protein D3C78_1214720 [compost metagenome]
MERGAAHQLLAGGTEQPASAAAGPFQAVGRHGGSVGDVPGSGCGASGVPGFLRDLHGRCGFRCPRRAAVIEGRRRVAADARGAAVRDPGRPGQRRAGDRAAVAAARLSLAAARPSGSDDWLFRFGQGRRDHRGGLGAVSGPGAAGGHLPRAASRTAVVPWSRRHRGPWWWSGARGDPVPATGFGGRAFPHH